MRPQKALAVLIVSGMAGLRAAILAGSIASAPSPTVVGAPPSELAVEPISIASASGSRLSGWFLKGRPHRGAILLLRQKAHGELIGVLGVSLGGAAAILSETPLDAYAMVLKAVSGSFDGRPLTQVDLLNVRVSRVKPGSLVEGAPARETHGTSV